MNALLSVRASGAPLDLAYESLAGRSAVLDRLLHHAGTVVIEAPCHRMKDQAGD